MVLNNFLRNGLLLIFFYSCIGSVDAQERRSLNNGNLNIHWEERDDGFTITSTEVDGELRLKRPLGEYAVYYSDVKPASEPMLSEVDDQSKKFPDSSYRLIFNKWRNSLSSVALNKAGEVTAFYPSDAIQVNNNQISFTQEEERFDMQSSWSLDTQYRYDVLVELTITAKANGYYSISSPTLAAFGEDELEWGAIPGHFQGNAIQPEFILSYGYGQGIPDKPVLTRERTAGTLISLISLDNGLTVSVIPEPGTSRTAWQGNKNTHSDWQLGLSLMNRKGELTPTAYHPILGEKDSYLHKGESKKFRFRYSIQPKKWFEVYKHAVYNIYRFDKVLDFKKASFSLTDRILAMQDYVKDDSISMWSTHTFQGKTIGGQAYLGAVVGSDKDAMKNSDYGAMWMLAALSEDKVLTDTRLPYARNFKLVQQEHEEGFFQGAAVGQYYLQKSNRFTEEWGNYVEPIALTYYTMLDIGNILLYEPDDNELKERLRLGAERLLSWQKEDGSWDVAYDRQTKKLQFADLRDLRPTFYGLLVAYRLLGNKKYLEAAQRGADWFIKNAVNKGHFLGVCGDFRFVPDFATGQSVQALLDLYEFKTEKQYLTAAIKCAEIYTGSIYTHPIPTSAKIEVKNRALESWQMSQVGYSFEHGGTIGSATTNGPILLASHAGMFVRLYELTKDSIYLDMARAGAWGQDAFLEPDTKVASYYWKELNGGAGRFPHHAWWQIGWITDYLMSEITLRSEGAISFPRGFITPKVGPHQPYGFKSGQLFGKSVKLWLPNDLAAVDNPAIDYIGALDTANRELYLILLNNSNNAQTVKVEFLPNRVVKERLTMRDKISLINEKGEHIEGSSVRDLSGLNIPKYGLRVIKIAHK